MVGATSWIRRHTELAIVCAAATLSVVAFIYFFAGGVTNLYADGIAHLNIARKVVDSPDASLWQRYMQIGTPWLPLQTILLLPLVANDGLWRSGVAGSIVSMFAFVVTAALIYRISRELYRNEDRAVASWLPVLSVAIYALNPSALFMQATPMTETVFMAALAAAIYFLQRWALEPTTRRLVWAGLAVTTSTLARYEAWPVAALSVLVVFACTRGALKSRALAVAIFALLAALGPAYWLWHNWAIFGDALAFLNGPHSARAIFANQEVRLGWTKVFIGHPLASVLWVAITAAVCAGPFLLASGLGGLALTAIKRPVGERLPVLLAVVPFTFHAYSVFQGEMQFFPFSAFGLLNVRYGLPHLLVVALFAPALVPLFRPRARRFAVMGLAALILVQYGYLISEGPSQLAVYQEAWRNGANAARAREWNRAGRWLAAHPVADMVWMNTGALGPLVPQGGLRFGQIIHEGSTRWAAIQDSVPSDVSMIIFEEGDPVAQRLEANPALNADFNARFEKRYSAGGITIFIRSR